MDITTAGLIGFCTCITAPGDCGIEQAFQDGGGGGVSCKEEPGQPLSH